jgi:hypothetical protein
MAGLVVSRPASSDAWANPRPLSASLNTDWPKPGLNWMKRRGASREAKALASAATLL